MTAPNTTGRRAKRDLAADRASLLRVGKKYGIPPDKMLLFCRDAAEFFGDRTMARYLAEHPWREGEDEE